jgi:hypothetical protein
MYRFGFPRAETCFAYALPFRMAGLVGSRQSRSARPVITPVSVMLIVLVLPALFPRRPRSCRSFRPRRKAERLSATYSRLVLTLRGNYRRFYRERNSLTARGLPSILMQLTRQQPRGYASHSKEWIPSPFHEADSRRCSFRSVWRDDANREAAQPSAERELAGNSRDPK